MSDLRAIAEAATPGPWTQGTGEEFAHWIDAANRVIVTTQVDADAAFIVAACNRFLAALDVIEAAKEVNGQFALAGTAGVSLAHALDRWDALA